jgi:hypothetical protein
LQVHLHPREGQSIRTASGVATKRSSSCSYPFLDGLRYKWYPWNG